MPHQITACLKSKAGPKEPKPDITTNKRFSPSFANIRSRGNVARFRSASLARVMQLESGADVGLRDLNGTGTTATLFAVATSHEKATARHALDTQ